MKALIPLALLALTACKTMPDAVNCTNARKVHALALQALDRACPVEFAR